jgi:uncharacterized protein YbaP (TraB family)
MRRSVVSLLPFALLAIYGTPRAASAQTTASVHEAAPATSTESATIDEVVVTGEQPGPSLWKITHGGTNVVWVLGTAGGIPKGVTWRSRQVEDVIAHAQVVIFGESVKSANIGFFRGLLLLRSVLKLRYNPDKAMLKDLITPERYDRWLVLRKKYFDDDKDYDRVRPMFIAMQLAGAVAEEAGLNSEASVGRIVATTAKKHDVEVRHAEMKVDIADPKKAIRDFSGTPRDKDLACFNETLDNLDADLDKTRSRASAWAVGDIETFSKLPAPVATPVCLEALTSAPGLQPEFTKMKGGLDDAWLWEVQKALELNPVTLAVTSLDDVLSATGRLATLRQRGYTVEAP